MSFCLDDGAELLYGPASTDEPATAILSEPPAVAGGLTRPTETSELRTAILQPPATAGGSDSSVAPSRSFDKRLLAAPVLLAIIVLGGFLGFRYFAPTKQIESIAVMPFVNESGNPDVEYLSDGMTETLINSLSQIPNLSVKARSSVFRYKGKEFDPAKVASDLNVQALLTGRVVERGGQMSLNLELIDPRTENVLWGTKYERRSSDLGNLQADIIRDVSNTLRQRLSGQEETRIAKQYSTDSEAYQLYLQGRFFLVKRTPATIRKASEYFRQAIDKDPNFALGYAGLADSYSLLAYYGGALGTEVLPKAKEEALKALSIDPDLAEAHRSLGYLHTVYYHDFNLADQEYRRAIELNPRFGEAYASYGTMLCRLGRFDEGLASLRKAVELEPLSVSYARLYGDGLLMARRFDEAMTQFARAVELDPSFSPTQFSLAVLYQSTGRYAETVEAYAKHHELVQFPELAAFGRQSFAKGGWQGYLRDMTERESPAGISSAYFRATLFVALGENNQAFAELERSYDKREYLIGFLKIDPRLDSLRGDPRFSTLMRKAGFPES